MILDNVENQIAFELSDTDTFTSYTEPLPLIPILDPDVLVTTENEGFSLHVDFPNSQSPSRGVFLWQVEASTSSPNEEAQVLYFVHTDGEASQGPESTDVDIVNGPWQLQDDPFLDNEKIRVSFELSTVETRQLEIRSDKFGVQLVMFDEALVREGPILAIEDIDLPDRFEADEPEDDFECTICLSQFVAGEIIQPMPHCDHSNSF